MQMTAAVINAGIGDLSLGLEMAGFHVAAAFEPDKKAAAIHQSNINAPVYPLLLENIDAAQFPNVDLLAAHIYLPAQPHNEYALLQNLIEILRNSKPRSFFLLFNNSSRNNIQFRSFLEEISGAGYRFMCQKIDVSKAAGCPVNEHMLCAVGFLESLDADFLFPADSLSMRTPDTYLQSDQHIDSWYLQIDPDFDYPCEGAPYFLCWKSHGYTRSDTISWNYIKVPLVRSKHTLRKITHREIANIKDFPRDYSFPNADRQWLYKKLMYAGNILIIKQIAGMISYSLENNPWRSHHMNRSLRFDVLFGRYLSALQKNGIIDSYDTNVPKQAAYSPDYTLCHGNQHYYFELKYYDSVYALSSKLNAVCERFSSLKDSGTLVLAVANEVRENIKSQCFDCFGIFIWDVKNLLWLFEDFPDIKNDFIALLAYSPKQIVAEPPALDLFQASRKCEETDVGWRERLLRIAPGREQFQDYETVCIGILKYVLGDYLTLWETQEPSNDGLYRFDLCCKIKNGACQDFFDTIRNYFNTKYIVFEFKNYNEKITQKEIYTTEKYLYEKALRKVAIIISRLGADEYAQKAIRGCLRETGKLILCLSDNALLEMLDIKDRGEQETAEFLEALLDDILIHLEK